jgi:2-phosphosulfolactate phosphatase
VVDDVAERSEPAVVEEVPFPRVATNTSPTVNADSGPRFVKDGYSLSPESLAGVPLGTRIVLPSPNGSQLSFLASDWGKVFAASLRNASAVAARLRAGSGPIAVIAGR